MHNVVSEKANAIITTKHDYTGLMMMASHQTFFGQINHLSSLVKFGQTNCYIYTYIISKEVIEFAKANGCPYIFQSLS